MVDKLHYKNFVTLLLTIFDEEGRAFLSERLFTLGGDVGISQDKINEILDCLEEVFGCDFKRF